MTTKIIDSKPAIKVSASVGQSLNEFLADIWRADKTRPAIYSREKSGVWWSEFNKEVCGNR